eukprot:95304_1
MLLCHWNMNQLRKSLHLSPFIHHCSNRILHHPLNQFCSVTKLQNTSNIVNEAFLINQIKENNKSDELSLYLANLNLKKSGTKDIKIERLLDHFNAHCNNLNHLTEVELRSFCNLLNVFVDDHASKDLIISNLTQFTANINTEPANSETETPFGFQVDQARQDQMLSQRAEHEVQSIQIDEKQSFIHKYPIDICSKVVYPNGSQIIFETSRIGHLSESAIIVNCKGTIVLTTATSKLKSDLTFQDGLDLKVDAHERSWARGYIPSGFQRSDGGITDYEILLCRMIDRAVRPLFTADDANTITPPLEVQILSNLLSCDDVYDTQILAINGASAAIYCSPQLEIGDAGPIGAVRVILNSNGDMICNPNKSEMEDETNKCNLLYVGTHDKCVMIETDATVVDEDSYCTLLQFAQTNVTNIVESIKALKALNTTKTQIIPRADVTEKYKTLSEIKSDILGQATVKQIEEKLFALYSNASLSKNDRNMQREQLEKEMMNEFEDEREDILSKNEWKAFYKSIFYEVDRSSLRNAYAQNNKRCDGRRMDEVRALNHMIDILPSCHGSALFERGNTQTLCSATLGSPRLARMRDMHQAGHPEVKHRLYFQYEMPPYATNEIKAIQSKNRRAIGHANIALNALKPLLPDFESFPYSVRVYSNITASDGSSSMASVCGGSLCLMDAGVPMRAPVAGISVGLMRDVLLTDIAGIEDHFGDMDFKIAGTRDGITSVQLDIKRAAGIPMDIMLNAVHVSHNARLQILDSMATSIAASKPDLKAFAPRVDIIDIPFRDLPRVIGSGGATKQQIQIETGCDINIFWQEECVEITAPNPVALNRAKRVIADVIGSQCRIGDIVTAKIINIQSYGVMVQIDDGSEHLVHISQWIDTNHYEGQEVDIMCIGFLGENRPNFSKKAAVWQQSDDPEDRARLRLMLDSLRPPARSRAHPGSVASATATPSAAADHLEDQAMTKREPLSIFTEYPDDDEEDVDEEDDSTHPIILPPKQAVRFGEKKAKGNMNDSIKHLIENISSNTAANNHSSSSPQQSRFANLYKDIHNKDNTAQQQSDGDNEIEHWKSFTDDLIKANGKDCKIENDDEGDDLLTDLFGEQHKYHKEEDKESSSLSSRASLLMGTIPELLKDLDGASATDECNAKEQDKWPWQQ